MSQNVRVNRNLHIMRSSVSMESWGGGCSNAERILRKVRAEGREDKEDSRPVPSCISPSSLFHILRIFHLKNYQFDPIALNFR